MFNRALGHRHRRTTITGALAALLAVFSLATAPGGSASPDPATFSNGTAKATAVLAKVAPGVGSLELGAGSGIAVSEIRNSLAQAQAQALDFGLIGTSLTAEGCDSDGDGQPDDPAVSPDQLPQPERVDNRNGNASATRDQRIGDSDISTNGAAFGAGRMAVEATTQPLARATATGAPMAFGPVATLSGGKAQAVTQIVDGAAREARATVDATIEIAGVVKLRGMHWEAIHRTGKKPDARAFFELGGAQAAGVPLPSDDLRPVQDAANTALAASGITIELPRVERFKEPADVVRVTPLRILLKDSPAGKTLLGPGLKLTRAQREQLFVDIVGIDCRTAGLLLVADINVAIVSGTGFLAIEIGGAEATSAEVTYESPFGFDSPLPSVPLPPGVLGLPGTPGVPGVPGAPGAPSSPTNPTQTIGSAGPLEDLCESVHPFKWPSCSHGAALPVGLLGLVATAGVAALDWRHQRRRSSSAPTTTTTPATA